MNSSFKKSEQITAGLRRSFKDADCKTANRICYGYTGQPDGALAINESEAISKLLSNEKYTGSVLLQKTMSFCGMQFSNDGELEKVLINHHHDAIIQPEVFDQVQRMKHERAKQPTPKMEMAFY